MEINPRKQVGSKIFNAMVSQPFGNSPKYKRIISDDYLHIIFENSLLERETLITIPEILTLEM